MIDLYLNPLSPNPTKWSNTLKQFVGKSPTNCFSVFDHFVGLTLKRLTNFFSTIYFYIPWKYLKTVRISDVFEGSAFLLVEAIPSSGSPCFYWFRGIQRSPNCNSRIFIKAMCRSSILKWQYFRDLITLFLEYNHNERTFNLRKL